MLNKPFGKTIVFEAIVNTYIEKYVEKAKKKQVNTFCLREKAVSQREKAVMKKLIHYPATEWSI